MLLFFFSFLPWTLLCSRFLPLGILTSNNLCTIPLSRGTECNACVSVSKGLSKWQLDSDWRAHIASLKSFRSFLLSFTRIFSNVVKSEEVNTPHILSHWSFSAVSPVTQPICTLSEQTLRIDSLFSDFSFLSNKLCGPLGMQTCEHILGTAHR